MKSHKHNNPNLLISTHTHKLFLSSSPFNFLISLPSFIYLKLQRFTPLFFFFFFLCFSLTTSMVASDTDTDSGPVVPTTALVTFLQRVQLTALRSYPKKQIPDPKSYIDLSLKRPYNLSTIESAFNDLTSESRHDQSVPVEKLEKFVKEYFDGAGEDLLHHEPVDFFSNPSGFLSNVENEQVREWAREVHGLWRNLSCRVSDSVRESPDRHTLLPLPEPVIIPGSRFREVYYWDSYWVIKGLMTSQMFTTAKGLVTNLMSLVETYGYALNGARAYYTNRSQPPLLSSMVYEIYNVTKDEELVKKAIPVLLKEYKFWNSGKHKVVIRDANGHDHVLSRYYAMWNMPRPESSVFDEESAAGFSTMLEKQRFHRDIATAAESGCDFSTRWMRDPPNFTTMATTSVVPVDLNVFLLKMELDIAFMMKISGDKNGSGRFLKASKAREKAFKAVFWNEKAGQWLDYWLSSNGDEPETWKAENQNTNVFASNFAPIWINSFNSDEVLVKKVVKALKNSGLIAPAGILTSLTNSGQQWDSPNGWAPQQEMIVTGLARSSSKEGKEMAEDIARRWIKSSYLVYKKSGTIHEKLKVTELGEYGGGGEYMPQTGFGWSNGVILAFLEEFGWPSHLNIEP
ncbi:Six-hairpin glycosidase superfamily [Arabidopsis suecica]|uniref:Alpha,alpha-trehalose glucohydrolase n=1 Tax=Arabidopsis suecica TaxID=45249 RepID=A0A8T1YJI0_ARASU|nr:Six-hairpin glycosidase superfamily [Arabidopsis suecica]